MRAPDFYFEVMREFGHRFTRLGEIATIRRGITSGCDAFFMPRNVSEKLLADYPTQSDWDSLLLMKKCKRADVASSKLVIVKCGDNTLHAIETQYVRPEVHSPMQIDRPIVSPGQVDRVVLWVNQALSEIRGTFAHQFISWGSKQTFASNKSKAVPVPERSSCASRPLWYDLTRVEPGIGFWPKTQKYRHIIAWNPHNFISNCRLYDVHPAGLSGFEGQGLMAVLNSTVIGLFKHFYGRYAGTEGTLDTEVVDMLMLEIPSPIGVSSDLCQRLANALEKISQREVTHLVEQDFLDCHTEERMRELQKLPLKLPLELQRPDRRELDLLVFELLGVNDAKRREELVDRLYEASTLYYREQRIQDIQSSINRTQSKGAKGAAAPEIAADAWNSLEAEWQIPLGEWLILQATKTKPVHIPDGEVRLPEAENFFEATTVYFGKKPPVSLVCDSRIEAELMAAVAEAGLRGDVSAPTAEAECQKLSQALKQRLAEGKTRLADLAEQRAGTEKLREQILEILYRWFIEGKK